MNLAIAQVVRKMDCDAVVLLYTMHCQCYCVWCVCVCVSETGFIPMKYIVMFLLWEEICFRRGFRGTLF